MDVKLDKLLETTLINALKIAKCKNIAEVKNYSNRVKYDYDCNDCKFLMHYKKSLKFKHRRC